MLMADPPPQCLVWLPLMHRLANVENGKAGAIAGIGWRLASEILSPPSPASLPSCGMFVLSEREHDGLPLPLPAVSWLPAVPELFLAWPCQRSPQQPAPNEGALVLGELANLSTSLQRTDHFLIPSFCPVLPAEVSGQEAKPRHQ